MIRSTCPLCHQRPVRRAIRADSPFQAMCLVADRIIRDSSVKFKREFVQKIIDRDFSQDRFLSQIQAKAVIASRSGTAALDEFIDALAASARKLDTANTAA